MTNENKLDSCGTIFIKLMKIVSIFLIVYDVLLVILIFDYVKTRGEYMPNDIKIKCFKSFDFINDTTKPQYNPDAENLGLAGKLYLNCTYGACHKGKRFKELDDEECDRYNDCDPYITYDYTEIKYNCSLECFKYKKNKCSSCPSPFYKEGTCSIMEFDTYSPEKICYAHNIIYFWKGKKYQIEKLDDFKDKEITYLNNAILKDENCSSNTKFCGILDNEGNKLCLPKNSECPPNVISTTKLNINNYRTTIIDNKTVYYGFDENAINKKIITGLYVDTDLYINREEESGHTITLDTYTISGLLKENSYLYKNLFLGYDPYNIIDNIDKKGKSYLKVEYNKTKPNLIIMKKKYNEYFINKSMNKDVIKPIRKISYFMILGIFYYMIVISLIFFLEKMKNNNEVVKKILCLFYMSFIFLIIPLVLAFIIMIKFNKAKNLDSKNNFKIIRILNIVYIILNSLFCILFIILIVITYKINKKRNSNNQNETSNPSENTNSENIITNQINTLSDINKKQ